MRVACILTVFPSVSETFVFGDLRALQDAGHEVGILHFIDGPTEIWQRDAQALRGGVVRGGPLLQPGALLAIAGYLVRRPLRLLSTLAWIAFHRGGTPRGRLKTLAILPKCVQFAADCRRWRADRVHAAWSNHAAIAALVVRRLEGIPYSMAAHAGLDVFRDPTMLREKIEGASFVAVCNEATLARLREIARPDDRSKLHLLSHGVDLGMFDGAIRASADGDATPRILFVGRLDYGKGAGYLLDAAARLAADGPPFRLDLVGTGPERDAVVERIAAHGLASRVTLHGAVPQERVAELLRSATVLAFPSEIRHDGGRDGLPNVVLEAMAAGVPVVASDIASVRQAVEDGATGLLVPQRDPEALADALRRVLTDPDLARRLAEAGRDRVRERFDRRVCGKRFVERFEESL